MDDLDALLAAQASAQVSDPVEALLSARASAKTPAPPPNAALQGGELSFGPFSTGVRTSPMVDQTLAGMGSGLMDLVQGVKQRFGYATPQDVVAKRAADTNLKGTTAGQIGNFAGQALPALATLPIPMLNTVLGAAATGGAMGLAQPTGPGESVKANTALGAAGGAIGQAGANVLGRLIAPVRPSMSAEDQRLAQVLMNNGVNLDLAQQTGSKPLKIINTVLDNLPFTSGIEEAKRAAQNQVAARAVMAKTGTQADNAAPEVLKGAFKRLGGQFDDLYGRNAVTVDDPLLNAMTATLDKTDNAAPIVAKTDKMLRTGPDIPGQKYQDIRTQLRSLQGSPDPEVSSGARDLKYAMDAAAARSFAPGDAALLAQTRQQYGNLLPIAKAMKSNNAVSGQIPWAQLRQAVASGDPRGYVQGAGDLNDLSRAAVRFLWDPASSPTAQRSYYMHALTSGLGAGLLGGGGTYMETGDIQKSLGGLGMGAAAGLLAPMLVQKAVSGTGLLGTPTGAYLVSGPARTAAADELRRLLSPAFMGAGSAVAIRP